MTDPDWSLLTVVTAKELAALLHVHPVTPTRWVRQGYVPDGAWFRTPGGHLRFWLELLPLEQFPEP